MTHYSLPSLPLCQLLKFCIIVLDSWTKLLGKSNFEGGLTIKNLTATQDLCNIMVITFHVLVLFISCKVSKLGFLRRKINVQRVLVIWLKFLQSSLLILILKSLKQSLPPFMACFLLLDKHFVFCHCTTCAHEHFKLCAHFYPLRNIS